MAMNALQLSFYRGVNGKFGAMQLNFRKPHYYCTVPKCKGKVFDTPFPPLRCPLSSCDGQKMESREGALFMEITSAKGPNDYDWDKKITMAFSITDLSKLLLVLEGHQPEVEIMHDPHAKSVNSGKITKIFKLFSPKGLYIEKGGVLVSAIQSDKEGNKVLHTVPLGPEEVKRLAICLRAVIPLTLAWC